MKSVLFATVTLALTSVFAYHDPDLNYHISQAQKLQNCGDGGYSYPAPAVQLSTTGVKVAAAQPFVSAPAYQYLTAGYSNAGYTNAGYSNAGYSTGVAYQAVAPKITYAAQPATTYQTSSLASNYATSSASNEVHGYATSAGLSSVAAPQRTVVPQATYAQAPIIAKVTAAPLFARFSVSPAKTTYVTQASGIATSAAKASLNSYSTVQSGGPVVSQVFSAPPSGYATSSALRVQPAQAYAQERYTSAPQAPTVAQYHQAFQPIAPVAQLGAAVTQYSSSAYNAAGSSRYFSPSTQYSAPAVAQYSAPVVTQYAAPAVAQYAAPQVASVTHPGAPAAVSQAVQYSAPTSYTQYSSPSFQYASSGGSAVQYAASGASASQYSSAVASAAQYATPRGNVQYAAAPAVTHVAAPIAVAAPAPRVVAPSGKNVHTDFLENYDAHPRYAYEYAVNDPHTGDIKQQKEERDGEVVKGQYSLVEPDGSVRTVNYVADWETGFHADVHNSKQNQH